MSGLKAQLQRAAAGRAVATEEESGADRRPDGGVEPVPAGVASEADQTETVADGLAEFDAVMARLTATPEPEPEPAAGGTAQAPPVSPLQLPQAAAVHTPAQAVAYVDQSHFIAPLAGEMTPWRIGLDHETGRRTITPVSVASMRLEFQPHTVSMATPTGVRSVPIVDLWLRSKSRREYPAGVVMQPEGSTPAGVFNLWDGFGVTPTAGDASPMVDHILMLCSGNAQLADYILCWLAFCVQSPGQRPEVAMVLRGGRGTGKGTVFNVMLKIFGAHGLHITQPKHLVGNFNSHLRSTLFLFADECHWPGDKAAEGVLKGLITETSLAIEMKGRDVFTAPNRVKLAMASNNEWVVPAGADERRYCVIDVSTERAQDHGYFGALHTWIEAGGAGVFLEYLLRRDLSAFNVRAVPQTAALDMQKIEGMAPLDRWILQALDTGTGITGGEWTENSLLVACKPAADCLDDYYKKSSNRGTRADQRGIGRRLNEIFECGPAVVVQRSRTWRLPGITDARRMAAKAFGLANYQWGTA